MTEDPHKVGRGKLFGRMQMADIYRIAMYSILLFAILMIREPCSQGVGKAFDTLVGHEPEAAPAPPADDGVEYIRLTEDEIKARFGAEEDQGANKQEAKERQEAKDRQEAKGAPRDIGSREPRPSP